MAQIHADHPLRIPTAHHICHHLLQTTAFPLVLHHLHQMADFHLDPHPRAQGTVQTSIHTFRAILLRAEKTLHHKMAGATPVITDILETALRQTEETEIEGLVAGVRIASVVRGCKIESASCTTAAVESSHHSRYTFLSTITNRDQSRHDI